MIHCFLSSFTPVGSVSISANGMDIEPAICSNAYDCSGRTSTITAPPLSNAAFACSTDMRGTAFSSRGRSSRGDDVGSTIVVSLMIAVEINVGAFVTWGASCWLIKLHASVARSKTDTDKKSFFDMDLSRNKETSTQVNTRLPVYLFCLFTVLQFRISFDAPADDGDTVIPELAFGNVDAETFGKPGSCIFTRGSKQVLIILHK